MAALPRVRRDAGAPPTSRGRRWEQAGLGKLKTQERLAACTFYVTATVVTHASGLCKLNTIKKQFSFHIYRLSSFVLNSKISIQQPIGAQCKNAIQESWWLLYATNLDITCLIFINVILGNLGNCSIPREHKQHGSRGKENSRHLLMGLSLLGLLLALYQVTSGGPAYQRWMPQNGPNCSAAS